MSVMSPHYTCKDCRRWARIGESSWGGCDVDIHLGNEDTFADDIPCPAFDDGCFDEAVDELVKSAYIVLARIVEYHDASEESERLHSAIYAVERLLKEREK